MLQERIDYKMNPLYNKLILAIKTWWRCDVPENDTVFIRLLEYGEQVGQSGTGLSEMFSWAKLKGFRPCKSNCVTGS